jgi:hypothetical protein
MPFSALARLGRSVLLVGDSNKLFRSMNGTNFTVGPSAFNTFGRDITVLSQPLTVFISCASDRYISKSLDNANSFVPVGGAVGGVGLPGAYNISGELRAIGAIGFQEFDGSPIPPTVTNDVAIVAPSVTMQDIFFANAKSFVGKIFFACLSDKPNSWLVHGRSWLRIGGQE